jgi:signal peptidase I
MRRGLDRHCRDPHKLRPMPRRAAFVRTRSRGRRVAASVRSLLVLVVAALLLRSLVVAPFSIPSESMLPLLRIGDVLLVTKWPYGWSRYSFPLAPPFLSGRLFGRAPARGDVVVFIHRHEQIRVADLLVPVNAQHPCREENGLAVRREPQPDGTVACRYPRLRETLPGGRAYDVIDLGHVAAADDMAAVRVPAGRYFLLGDNRDRSLDSRFAPAAGGIGTVPAEYLIGRAWLLFFSHDGTADPLRPWTWWRAMQGDRTAAAL